MGAGQNNVFQLFLCPSPQILFSSFPPLLSVKKNRELNQNPSAYLCCKFLEVENKEEENKKGKILGSKSIFGWAIESFRRNMQLARREVWSGVGGEREVVGGMRSFARGRSGTQEQFLVQAPGYLVSPLTIRRTGLQRVNTWSPSHHWGRALGIHYTSESSPPDG